MFFFYSFGLCSARTWLCQDLSVLVMYCPALLYIAVICRMLYGLMIPHILSVCHNGFCLKLLSYWAVRSEVIKISECDQDILSIFGVCGYGRTMDHCC